MSSAGSIDAILQRLVSQFSSPYDFTRELVQNAMDAGSDFVEVTLHTHPGDGTGEAVYELAFTDGGEGMDEPIIDNELTRLFSTGKAQDRTMAGGFGIGFVSVFAWEPERVLVQTGRHGEAWELLFHPDFTFEKDRVDEPIEGTTVRLFRRGLIDEREALSEAVRDALWRWCRFADIDVSFEDLAAGSEPQSVRDAPVPADAVVQAERRDGSSRIAVAFAVPANAVLLRHGLILAEGATAEVLPDLPWKTDETSGHLRVWADSPRLRTSMARDKVIDDQGRSSVEVDIVELAHELREALLERIETMAGSPGDWDEHRHLVFAHLHAHLRHEHHALSEAIVERPLLRSAAATAVSAAGLSRRARMGVVAVVEPGPVRPARAEVRLAAGRCGVPAIVGRWPTDRPWIDPILSKVGLRGLPVDQVVTRVAVDDLDHDARTALVEQVLLEAGVRLSAVKLGRFEDASDATLCGVEIGPGVAMHAAPLPTAELRRRALWINADHPLFQDTTRVYTALPDLAALALSGAIAPRLDADLAPRALAEALDELAD